MNNYISNLLKRAVCVAICLFVVCFIVVMVGCVDPKQNIETADIYKTFEEDHAMLQQVTTYMLQLIDEKDLHMIIIENSSDPMTINYGDEMVIEDTEIKEIIKGLFERGYIRISFNQNTPEDEVVIKFKRFKKKMSYEYSSGFAYSPDAKGELNIQYIISQEELSIPGWYFYEKDYNEWRVNN